MRVMYHHAQPLSVADQPQTPSPPKKKTFDVQHSSPEQLGLQVSLILLY